MTKFSKVERWIFLLTLVFLLCTIGYFLLQNQNRELSYVVAERQPESTSLPAEETKDSAPGLLEGERINLNTASAEDLMRLPGIGKTRAADIVAYRQAKGPFSRLEDIMEVSGIGQKTYEKLAPYICVSED